eukprot:NODE_3321_length_801_cov_847.536193.p1 GENE.NODE_3321_length_801_cov_847.536193~~NODE_3321_length_801_cov_847.536193.p1  ORF type:complete len:199 (-),score=34.58 NODE_3321_length_801_cov_847.536193:187-783(-)
MGQRKLKRSQKPLDREMEQLNCDMEQLLKDLEKLPMPKAASTRTTSQVLPQVGPPTVVEVAPVASPQRIASFRIPQVRDELRNTDTFVYHGIQFGDLRGRLILKAQPPSGSGAESLTTGPISWSLTLNLSSDETLNCQLFLGEQQSPFVENDFNEQTTVAWQFEADIEEDGSLTAGAQIQQPGLSPGGTGDLRAASDD